MKSPARLIVFSLALLASLVSPPPAMAREDWPNYEVILWHRQPDGAYATLPRLGYSGGLVFGMRENFNPDQAGRDTAPLRAAGLRWYVENIATDFYSAYHRWLRGKPVNWLFLEAQRRFRENPNDPAAFVREPGFGDPAWRARIAERMAAHARLHLALAAPHRPFFLNLGDEPGIADLSAEWDFDRTATSLAAFRAWLQTEYPSLDALNAQWDTTFARWDDVVPVTTDQAIGGRDAPFSGWVDFKSFMDRSFAEALQVGRQAVRAVDPTLPVGIAGGQAPGPGGWDYGLLAEAVDLIETYDFAGSATIAQGLNPDLLLLSTSFNATPTEWHRLWRQTMLGVRGIVVWDGESNIVAADGTPGPRGLASAATFAALRAGIPAQLLASTPEQGPVGVLYSQPSFRMRWLLDRRAEARAGGPSWAERGADAEHAEENAWRAALRRTIDGLALAGVTPRWLTPAKLSTGGLEGLKVLILPHAIALGPDEVTAIRAFVAAGGMLVADSEVPGLFDARGRRRESPPLGDQVIQRAIQTDAPGPLAAVLRIAGAVPDIALKAPPGVEMRLFRNGLVRLLALQPARPPEGQAQPLPVSIGLPAPAMLRSLGSSVAGQQADRLDLDLDPVVPTVIAISPVAFPELRILQTALGVQVSLAGPSPAAVHMLRLEVLDVAGQSAPERRWVVRLPADGKLDWLPPAPTPAGQVLRVTDVLSGNISALTLIATRELSR